MRRTEIVTIEKLWSHYVARWMHVRKDFRYAWNLRHSDSPRVDWASTIPARIGDIEMTDLMIKSCGIGWDKYGLTHPQVYVEKFLRG